MTLLEIEKVYKQRIQKIKDEEKSNNIRTARICCIIANCNRDKKKQPKAFTVKDFMPVLKKEKKQSINDMAIVCKMLTIMNGGTIKN